MQIIPRRPILDPVSETDPRWLSAQERQLWLTLSRLMTVLPPALDAQLERDAGLNYYEYIVLAMLSEEPDRSLPMSRLSLVTAGSLSRLSNVVKRLEARDYVGRCAHPDDRRVKVVRLLDAGNAALVAAAPAHVGHVRDLVVDAVPAADLDHLTRALRRVLDRVSPEGFPALDDPA